MNKKLIILIAICLLLVGCGKESKKSIEVGKITCEQMSQLMDEEIKPVLVDVRTKEEYDEGHLDDAVNIPVNTALVDTLSMMKGVNPLETPIIVYCKSGVRSAQAFEALQNGGFKKVYDLGAMSNCK